MTGEGFSGESLPRAPVLGYLSNISTPTRVRIVTARVVLVFASINLFVAAWATARGSWDIWQLAHANAAMRVRWAFLPGPATPTIDEYIEAVRENIGSVFLFGFCVTPGCMLLFLAGPIRRGRLIPSILAIAYFVPLAFLTALATAFATAMEFVMAVGLGRPEPVKYLWLWILPVGAVIVLLLKDVCGFLWWIARNPMIDKPPETFLPRKMNAGA